MKKTFSFKENPIKETEKEKVTEKKEDNRKGKDADIEVNAEDPLLMPNDYIASCFEYKCEGGDLFVIIKNHKHRCRSGDIIEIKGYQGNIFCPDNENLCSPRFKCKFGCVDRYSNSNPFFE